MRDSKVQSAQVKGTTFNAVAEPIRIKVYLNTNSELDNGGRPITFLGVLNFMLNNKHDKVIEERFKIMTVEMTNIFCVWVLKIPL